MMLNKHINLYAYSTMWKSFILQQVMSSASVTKSKKLTLKGKPNIANVKAKNIANSGEEKRVMRQCPRLFSPNGPSSIYIAKKIPLNRTKPILAERLPSQDQDVRRMKNTKQISYDLDWSKKLPAIDNLFNEQTKTKWMQLNSHQLRTTYRWFN